MSTKPNELPERMDHTSARAKSFKRQGVTIVVLLLLAAAYFAVIVPRKSAYFTNRYFQTLADTGDQLKVAVANLGSALVNAQAIPTSAPEKDLPQGSLQEAVIKAGSSAPESVPLTNRIRAAISLVPNLELISISEKTASTNLDLHFEVGSGARGPTLEFEYVPATDTGPTTNKEYQIKARSNLGRLLQPFVARGEFDDLLLVTTNGEVLYQLGGSPLRLARLEVAADKSTRTNLANSAGNDYLVFTQPVVISLATKAGAESPGRKWVLCGLVDTEHFRKQTWGVNYRVLEGFAFVALLLIVSWPFLNVCSLGLKGGLKVFETFFVAFSLVFTTALLTFLTLDSFTYDNMDGQLEERSPLLAQRITSNWQAELEAIADQVNQFNHEVLSPGSAVNRSNILEAVEGPNRAARPYPWLRGACWIGTNGQQAIKWAVQSQLTPMIKLGWREYFRAIAEGRAWTAKTGPRTNGFFVEPLFSSNTGENFAAFSTGRTNDPGVVAEMDFRPLSLMNPVLPTGYGFAVIDATGKVLFHSDEKRNLRENFFNECENHPRLLAAVSGRATVQFDANYYQRRCNLRVSPLPDLPWSLVVFHEAAPLQITHLEVVGVAGCWFLIYAGALLLGFGLLRFFRGQRAARWLWPRRDLAATYRLVAALNLALVALGLIVALLNFDPWVTLGMAGLLPVTGLALTPLALRRRRCAPAWSGALAMGLRVQARRWVRRACGPHWLQGLAGLASWDDYRYGYVSAFGSLLLLVAFLPTLAFVKLASDTEMELMVKQAQMHLVGDFEARARRVRAEVLGFHATDASKNRPLALANPEAFIQDRLNNSWDVYDTFFFGSTITITNARGAAFGRANFSRDTFHDLLVGLRPHFNALDVEARGLLPDAASDDSWHWQHVRSWLGLRTALALTKQYSSPSKSAGPTTENRAEVITVHSDVPHCGLPGPIRATGLGLLLCVPFVLVYLVAQKILFLGEAAPKRLDQRGWPRGKYLLLGPPHSHKGAWLTPQYFPMLGSDGHSVPIVIDLRTPEGRAWLEEASQDKLFEHTSQPIVVEHFEYNLTDPEFNRKKFRFLRLFAADEKRPMILVSNVHPLSFPMADSMEASPAVPPALALDKHQRADLLSPFKRIFKEDSDGHSLAAPPADTTAFTARAHYRSLFATCSPKEQQILYQVADERLISCGQPEIQTLLGRGLLKLAPDLRLMDDGGLRAFVLSHYRPELDEETKEEPSLWHDLKGPAVTVLVILAGFFFVTQRAVWDYTVGLVPAFVAGVTVLTQIPRVVQMLKSKPPPGP